MEFIFKENPLSYQNLQKCFAIEIILLLYFLKFFQYDFKYETLCTSATALHYHEGKCKLIKRLIFNKIFDTPNHSTTVMTKFNFKTNRNALKIEKKESSLYCMSFTSLIYHVFIVYVLNVYLDHVGKN